MATLGTNILEPALRLAGVTVMPGVLSNPEKIAEMILATNRFMGMLNIQHNGIYQTGISVYTLALTQIQTLGPTGTWVGPRPVKIEWANLLSSGSPQIRTPLAIWDIQQWEMMQPYGSGTPFGFYPDEAVTNRNLYFNPTPNAAMQVELFTWLALKDDFTLKTDAFVFPKGYETAIVKNLAIEAAMLHGKPVTQDMRSQATKAIAWVKAKNSKIPYIGTDVPNANRQISMSRDQFKTWGM